MRLRNEQRLPELTAPRVGGDTLHLPAAVDDGWAAVLVYRGHW